MSVQKLRHIFFTHAMFKKLKDDLLVAEVCKGHPDGSRIHNHEFWIWTAYYKPLINKVELL